ncbi:MAG: acetylornithine deacetylase [Pirellulaceae bacterium]|nr:MAG: acetylornithine deacetylase [Pirellulaceae bacterium]
MDVLRFAQQLVAIDSVTTHSNEELAAVLAQWLEQQGFSVEIDAYLDLQGTPKKTVAAVRYPDRGDHAARAVGYFGHSDVVAVENWDCVHGGPFDAVCAQGRLWGRGACDMKGSIAAVLAAISRISVRDQRAPIYVFITGDEECGMLGAERLVTRSVVYREFAGHQGVAIIGEPTMMRLVAAHKGGCRLEIVATGVAAHSSTAEGQNANWALIPFLSALAEINRHAQEDPRWQNAAFDPPHLTFNPVIINEPTALNITVGRAVCRLFYRPMPNTQISMEEVKETILTAAQRSGLTVQGVRELPPLYTPSDSPAVRVLLRMLNQEAPLAVSYATDGCVLTDLRDRVVMGPGSIQQAHRGDEWISLDELQQGTFVFERVLRRFCCAEDDVVK